MAASADYRDRLRSEQVPQAGDVGLARAVRDSVQVVVQAPAVVAGQGHGEPDHAVSELPLYRQARVREHPLHGHVLRQRLSRERGEVSLPGQRHQVLEQQGGHAAPVHLVGHRERDLGYARPPGRFVTRHADQLAVQPGQQRRVVRIVRPAEPLGLSLRRLRAEAEEPEVGVIRRHLLVHLPDIVRVIRLGRANLDCRAIRKQGVARRRRSRHRGTASHASRVPGLMMQPSA